MAISNAASISIKEPRAISKNLLLSVADLLDAPSALFRRKSMNQFITGNYKTFGCPVGVHLLMKQLQKHVC